MSSGHDHFDPAPGNSAPRSKIRKHYFLDRYVIIAPGRSLRPEHLPEHSAAKPNPKPCPFCGNEEFPLLTLPGDGPWRVRVVPNRYAAVSPDNPAARGAHEVYIETPDHNTPLSALSLEQVEEVFDAWKRRQMSLLSLPGIRYVQTFKNVGQAAAASIDHAHSQAIAIPFLPPSVLTEAAALTQHRKQHNACAVCSLLSWEESEEVRIISAGEDFIALAPFAASSPYGVWILPRRHLESFQDLKPCESASLARLLKEILGALDQVQMAYNLFLHEGPGRSEWHWSLKIEPRSINTWAGFELGTGIIINPVAPETAARWYRENLRTDPK